MSSHRQKASRARIPAAEPLEGLRLSSGNRPDLPPVPAELGLPVGVAAPGREDASGAARGETAETGPVERADPRHHGGDLGQDSPGLLPLFCYLNRAWARAGIAPQQHEDCTQAVFLVLLGTFGADRFRHLIGDIGRRGIGEALGRGTIGRLDFFRAIDAVKKRARRQRVHSSLEAVAVIPARDDHLIDHRRAALREAISRVLGTREAALIRATLAGEGPAEIAEKWGVAAKTISNEKTGILRKLRNLLREDLVQPYRS